MKPPIPGIDISVNPEVLIITSHEPLRILSSSPIGGGLRQTRYILNMHVSKGYDRNDPAPDLIECARNNGIREEFVGMMTAAYVEKACLDTEKSQNTTVCALLTAGLSNACTAGITPPMKSRPGTINIILLIDARLSDSALVNAVITATEAKCDVLRRLNWLTPEGELATGTSTDAVAIATTGHGELLHYAGPTTAVGWSIAQTVRRSLEEILTKT